MENEEFVIGGRPTLFREMLYKQSFSLIKDQRVIAHFFACEARFSKPFCQTTSLTSVVMEIPEQERGDPFIMDNMDGLLNEIMKMVNDHEVRLIYGFFDRFTGIVITRLREAGLDANLGAWFPFSHSEQLYVYPAALIVIGPCQAMWGTNAQNHQESIH